MENWYLNLITLKTDIWLLKFLLFKMLGVILCWDCEDFIIQGSHPLQLALTFFPFDVSIP